MPLPIGDKLILQVYQQKRGAGGRLSTPGRGSILKGVVIRMLSKGRVLVQIGGEKVQAATDLDLTPGQVLSLMVKEDKGPVVLKLLPTDRFQRLKRSVEKEFSIKEPLFFKRLYGMIKNPGLKGDELAILKSACERLFDMRFSPEGVKVALSALGLFWEAKLRRLFNGKGLDSKTLQKAASKDLKGALLISMDSRCAEDIRRLSDTILNLQQLNQYLLLSKGVFFLPLPVKMPGYPIANAQIYFYTGNKGGYGSKDENPCHMVLMLDMSVLGPVRVHIGMKEHQIQALFFVTSKKSREAVMEKMGVLSDQLQKRGFFFHFSGCMVKDKEQVLTSPVDEHGTDFKFRFMA